jgi:protein SCO1/2
MIGRASAGRRGMLFLAAAVGALSLAPSFAPRLAAQVGVDDPILRQVEGIEIVEHLDSKLPLDLQFLDETGRYVPLSQFFDGTRPVVLNLAYFSCPMLCNLVVEGFVESIDEMGWTLGDEFRVVTVSIDPRDTPAVARNRKDILVREFERPDALTGWHLLTGHEQNIRAVADTVGFGYEWNAARSEYAHGAVLVLLTPDGRVSRYIYGVKFDPKVLRLSLVEASEGKVGSTIDRIFLLCFHYDPTTAQYGPVAMRLMQIGGGATVIALLLGFTALQVGRRRSLTGRVAAGPPVEGLSDAIAHKT